MIDRGGRGGGQERRMGREDEIGEKISMKNKKKNKVRTQNKGNR
jgi:hypothetical protein